MRKSLSIFCCVVYLTFHCVAGAAHVHTAEPNAPHGLHFDHQHHNHGSHSHDSRSSEVEQTVQLLDSEGDLRRLTATADTTPDPAGRVRTRPTEPARIEAASCAARTNDRAVHRQKQPLADDPASPRPPPA